jgi:hypothetical protein
MDDHQDALLHDNSNIQGGGGDGDYDENSELNLEANLARLNQPLGDSMRVEDFQDSSMGHDQSNLLPFLFVSSFLLTFLCYFPPFLQVRPTRTRTTSAAISNLH